MKTMPDDKADEFTFRRKQAIALEHSSDRNLVLRAIAREEEKYLGPDPEPELGSFTTDELQQGIDGQAKDSD